MTTEVPVRFDVSGTSRIGIVHQPSGRGRIGILIVVGGQQYRVGSHRQFVLLARALASAGFAVMRFDCGGMGDSEGEAGEPEPALHYAPDIRAALDAFAACVPQVGAFVLCGLCDGASAALMYGPTDRRVQGLVLLNPWLSDPSGAARAVLRHYYLQRLRDPDLWRKIASGGLDVRGALRSLGAMLRTARVQSEPAAAAEFDPAVDAGARIDAGMAAGLDAFDGRILLILSGLDLTASQYSGVVNRSRRWRTLFDRGKALRIDMPRADHTFSRRSLLDELAGYVIDWLSCF
jgi:exosortase A-associated hydrolase 1